MYTLCIIIVDKVENYKYKYNYEKNVCLINKKYSSVISDILKLLQ